MEKISTPKLTFYAALSGLLSAVITELASTFFEFSELASYILPGAVYGAALYISGIAGQRISGSGQHAIALVVLITGSAIAWYAAVRSLYYVSLGGGMLDLKQLVLAGFIGAFIVSLLLIYCWHIKRRRSYFVLCISAAGAAVPILWHGIKYITETLNVNIEDVVFFATWQAVLLISASLFIGMEKNTD